MHQPNYSTIAEDPDVVATEWFRRVSLLSRGGYVAPESDEPDSLDHEFRSESYDSALSGFACSLGRISGGGKRVVVLGACTTTVTPTRTPATREQKFQTATRIADKMFQQQPDWIVFFREVLGVDGLVRKLFTTPEELADFEKTPAYAEIQLMVNKLREKSGATVEGKEPTRVITVRLPKSLHESLRAEAHDRKTTMNQLCIRKLLQVIDEQMAIAEE